MARIQPPGTYGRANLLVEYKAKPYVYKYKPIPGGRKRELGSFKLEGDLKKKAARLTRAFRKMGGKGGLVYKTNQDSVKFLAQRAVSNLDRASKAHGRPQNFRSGKLARVVRNGESHVVSTKGFRFMDEKKVRAQIDYAFSLEFGDSSQIGRNIYFLFLGKSPARKLQTANKNTSQAQADRLNESRQFNSHGASAEKFRFSHRPSFRRSSAGVRQAIAGGANAQRVSDRIIGPRELHTGGKGGGAFKSKHIVDGRRYRVTIKNPVPQYRYGRDAAKFFVDNDQYDKLLQARYDAGPEKADGVAMVPGLAAARKASKKQRSAGKSKSGYTKFGPVTSSRAT